MGQHRHPILSAKKIEIKKKKKKKKKRRLAAASE